VTATFTSDWRSGL